MGAHGSLASVTWTLAILSGCGGSDLMLPGAGGPGELVVVSGDRQQGQTGTRLEKPLVVQVNDAGGRPAPGAEVAFAGSAGSPAVHPDTATTDDNGRASTRVTLGDAEGAQTIVARLAGSSNISVLFHVTAMAPSDGGGQGGGGGGSGNGGGNGNGGHNDQGEGD
jgi:hypothetical protein